MELEEQKRFVDDEESSCWTSIRNGKKFVFVDGVWEELKEGPQPPKVKPSPLKDRKKEE